MHELLDAGSSRGPQSESLLPPAEHTAELQPRSGKAEDLRYRWPGAFECGRHIGGARHIRARFALWTLLLGALAVLVVAVLLSASPAAAQTVSTAPSAPLSLAATPSHGQVMLAWQAPARDGGSAVTGYEYRHAEGASVPASTPWRSAGTNLTARVSGLTNGRAYAFEVRAVNETGGGDPAAATATPERHPTVTVRHDRAVYRFAEDAGDAGVTIVAQAEAGDGRPTERFFVSVSTRAVPGGASPHDDYEALAIHVGFGPGDFSVVNGVWQARNTVALAILDDEDDEDDEDLRLTLQKAHGQPPWLRLVEVDGTTACGFECLATVTIEDNDGPPSLPQHLTATRGSGQVTLTWQAPARDGGSAVTGYEYRHAEGASVPASTPWRSAGTSLTVRFSGLTDGTRYTFQVRAVSARGEGPAAQTRSRPGLVPSAPRNLTAKAHHGAVTLSWEAPADRGTSAIARYQYRYAEGAAVPSGKAWRSVGTARIRTIDGLTNGTAYAFEVRAVNKTGGGDPAAATATPERHPTVTVRHDRAAYRFAEDAGDAGVTIVAQVEAGGGRPTEPLFLDVSTRAVPGGASPHDDYETLTIHVGFGPGDFSVVNGVWQARNTVALAILDDDADEDDEDLRLTFQKSHGLPPWVLLVDVDGTTACGFECLTTVTIEDNDGPPSLPQHLTATRGSGQVTLTWQAPARDDGSAVTGYEYRHAEGASVPAATPWQSAGTSLTATVSGLTDGTRYTFQVRALNARGEGPAAQTRSKPGLVPSAPRNLTAKAHHGAVTLSWEAPADRGTSAVARYQYRYAEGAAVPSGKAWRSVGTARTITVDGLTNGTAYAFEVRAVNKTGGGDPAAATATPERHPTVTVRHERAAYRFAEDAGDAGVTIVAQVERGGGRPAARVYVSVSTQAVPGGASSPDDYEALSITLVIGPEDFSVVNGVWQARSTVALAILDDEDDEDDEDMRLTLQMSPGQPPWVRLVEVDGTIACSGCLTTVTIEDNDGAPSSPQHLTARPGNSQVTLAWQAPAVPGSSPVTGYEYRHAEGASVPAATPWRSAGTSLAATVSGLTNGTAYAFEVRAMNEAGASASASAAATPATQVTAPPTPLTVPDAPQDFSATPGDRAVVLDWQAPARDGGSAVTGYEYRHAEGASVPAATPWRSAGTSLAATVSGLTNGTAYAFEVRAMNEAGASAIASVTSTPLTVPDAPQDFSATPGDREAVLAWQAPARDGGSAVTGYEYRHAEGASVPAATPWRSAGTSLAATVSGLTNGTAYAFEVRAVSEAGASASASAAATPATQVTAPPTPLTVPDAPQDFSATPGDRAVVLAWQAPAHDGGSAVTGYEYRHAEGASVPASTPWRSAGTSLAATVSGLTNGTAYAFEVRAVNDAGASASASAAATPATQVTAPPTPLTVPDAPQDFSATPGDRAVVLAWQAPARDGGSAVTGYEYRHAAGASVPASTPWRSAGASLAATVSGLTNGTAYAFEVRAVSDAGASAIASVTSTPLTVPDAPQDFSATPGDREVVLAWQAPARDGGSAVTGYEYRHAAGASVPAATPWRSAGTSLAATVSGLTNGTAYAFEVRAVSDAGASAIASVTSTPLTVPDAPQDFSATPGDREAVLAWQAPARDGGSAVTGYEYRHAEGASVPASTPWQSAGTSLAAAVSGLTNGTAYAFEVRAMNEAGASASASAAATPFAMPAVAELRHNISGFMLNRANALANNQPRLTRFLRNGEAPSELSGQATEDGGTVGGSLHLQDVWLDAQATWSNGDGAHSRRMFGAAGGHWRVTDRLLAGLMFQADLNEGTLPGRKGSVDGAGWLAGPYFAAQIEGQPLYFEGRLMYGQTGNRIAHAAGAAGKFDTERWLAQLRMEGDVELEGDLKLTPYAELLAIRDSQSGFADSAGRWIGGQEVSLKQSKAGIDFRLPVSAGDGNVTLTGGVAGVYSATAGGAADSGFAGGRARADLGVDIRLGEGVALEIEGYYDGIGSPEYESHGFSSALKARF